jgi:hypothetical protein
MSAQAIVITVEAVILAVAVLFLVALLRSHAEILRRLAALEGPTGERIPASSEFTGSGAQDIVGQTLDGDAAKIALGPGLPSTLLAFLSSGCASCGSLWSSLARGAGLPAQTRLLVVTKGPEAESAPRLKELASPGVETVMSSEAWSDFSVPSTPHFVLVDGQSAQIAGRGTATSWEQLLTLVNQAMADTAYQAGHGQTSSDRARRVEETLAAAGITAGHPSLYPSRVGQASRP